MNTVLPSGEKLVATNSKRKININDENGKLQDSSSSRTVTKFHTSTASSSTVKISKPVASEGDQQLKVPNPNNDKKTVPILINSSQNILQPSAAYNYTHFIPNSSTFTITKPNNSVPTMSKLTMNIGFGKNLLANSSTTTTRNLMPHSNNYSQHLPPTYNNNSFSTDSNPIDELDFLELFTANPNDNNSDETVVDYVPTFDEAMQFHSIHGSTF